MNLLVQDLVVEAEHRAEADAAAVGEVDRHDRNAGQAHAGVDVVGAPQGEEKVTYVFSNFYLTSWRTLRGSFSAVSTPIFASKFSSQSS